MNKVLLLFAALAAVALVNPALAQDAPEAAAEDEAPAEAVAEEAEADEAPAADSAATDDSATEAEQALEQDLAVFWGQRREIEVVQRRLYEKDGRVELVVYGGVIPNDDFIMYYPLGARVGYHFSEQFEVEASFAYAIEQPSDLGSFLEAEAIDLKRADIQETIQMYYNVNLLWAPIYGKLSFLGYKLTHFDMFVGLGAGVFHTTEFPEANPDGNKVPKFGGNTVLGFRWFINDTFNIRTEYRNYFFQKFKGGVSIPVELTLGLGITI